LWKKNLIFWHPWDPWGRIHIDLNKNSVRTGCVEPRLLSARMRYLTDNNKDLYCPLQYCTNCFYHGLWTPREEIVFTLRPKIQSQSQIIRYGQSIFFLPHRPKFS
jgi:hypothetical protein